MARFTRIEVAQMMNEQGLVPLFYHPDPETGRQVLQAVYQGGGRLLEFTNRGDFAHEVFADLVKYAMAELPDMILGAGSVHDAGTAAMYMQRGANFIVSPVIDVEVARVCNRRKVLWAPGCGSTTEIARAEELGAEIVKVFPGNTLGPGFVKSILGPAPWTSIMPTGGVSPDVDNLRGWFDAGVVCVGMGSKLISSDLLKKGDYRGLQATVEGTLKIIRDVRGRYA
jgi:2-dehydro-3-deoxyphosphogluconate aldolase/(4S)-4-hydroxy-2-oxoglutarate aldolase